MSYRPKNSYTPVSNWVTEGQANAYMIFASQKLPIIQKLVFSKKKFTFMAFNDFCGFFFSFWRIFLLKQSHLDYGFSSRIEPGFSSRVGSGWTSAGLLRTISWEPTLWNPVFLASTPQRFWFPRGSSQCCFLKFYFLVLFYISF